MNGSRDLERKSSAVTLSDMEMFIFPELMYSLVLANMMSPCIWRWRDDDWFKGLQRMNPYRRITRLKQYVMDHYVFNLDLDTWGLTHKDREMARFRDFIDEATLARSNALFGYEGDKYYFDIDIRTHFGLDKYEGDIIPYWKTETVEAMDAFAHKPDCETGAGECVSLATLYAAALFLVADIPLSDIYLMATPLHSQNFVDVRDGILTNNRRLVTKNMWFNGTELSAQARRALENERVTIVAHETGVVHTVYEQATMDRARYDHFGTSLREYLTTPLTDEIFGNFMRQETSLQKCFQARWPLHGQDHYIAMERLFKYEHGTPYRVTDNTRDKLMDEIDQEEFQNFPLAGRIVLNDLEAFVESNRIDIHKPSDVESLKRQFASNCLNAEIAIESLIRFCHVEPRLPDPAEKVFAGEAEPLGLDADMEREELIERLESIRDSNTFAGLAFYAYRDLNRVEAEPYLLAAVQRNPVAVEGAAELDDESAEKAVRTLADTSIYEGDGRMAQPDEVWNYGRGDGAEKAVLLADILRARRPDETIRIAVEPGQAVLKTEQKEYRFDSAKNLSPAEWPIP